jgi:hypothetical protein
MGKRVQLRKSRGMAKRFAIYSAIGGACGMTFGATAAEAEIIFTDFHGVAWQTNSKNYPLDIDVDKDGETDFTFRLTVYSPNANGTASNWAALDPRANSFVRIRPGPKSDVPYGPAYLSFGAAISGQNFHALEGPMQLAYTNYYPANYPLDAFFGAFGGANFPDNPPSGYVGLKFASGGGETVFGWAKVSIVGDVTNPNFPAAEIHVDGFAYATDGTPITAGQVPEPTSGTLSALGLLAMGAAGVAERRRRKKLAANHAEPRQ